MNSQTPSNLKYFIKEKKSLCVAESFLAVQKQTSLATGPCKRKIRNAIRRNKVLL